jgi:ribosome maturation factor RimP
MKLDIDKIVALAESVAREEMLDLFDVDVAWEGPRAIVRVFLDREGGINLGECESFSRKMSAALDVHDPMPCPYVLEVSSPGLNRRLRKPEHFAGAAGRRVKVSLSEPVEGGRNYAGTLVSADGEGIAVEREGRTFRFPYRLIRKANLEIAQDELFGKGKKKR